MTASRLASLAAATVLVAAGVVAGCGGGDDESDALTQEEFITQANELCTTFTTESDASTAAYEEAGDDIDAAADAYAEVGEQMGDLAAGIDDLGAPEGDEETIDELVSLGEQLSDEAAAGADALRNEDIDGVAESNAAAEEIRTQFDQVAGDYGLTECEA